MRYLGRTVSAPLFAATAVVVAIAASAPHPAAAQDRTGTAEITPFGGRHTGGRLNAGATSIFGDDVDVRHALTFGLRAGYNVNPWLGIEAGFSTARSDIESRGDGRTKLGRLDEQHYEADLVFNLLQKRVVPYVVLGAGVTRLQAKVPDVSSEAQTRFSANVGLGVKAFVDEHFGVRAEWRSRATYMSDQPCDANSPYCGGSDQKRDDDWFHRWYANGELTAGAVIAF